MRGCVRAVGLHLCGGPLYNGFYCLEHYTEHHQIWGSPALVAKKPIWR